MLYSTCPISLNSDIYKNAQNGLHICVLFNIEIFYLPLVKQMWHLLQAKCSWKVS